jgi:hypothetical protein
LTAGTAAEHLQQENERIASASDVQHPSGLEHFQENGAAAVMLPIAHEFNGGAESAAQHADDAPVYAAHQSPAMDLDGNGKEGNSYWDHETSPTAIAAFMTATAADMTVPGIIFVFIVLLFLLVCISRLSFP